MRLGEAPLEERDRLARNLRGLQNGGDELTKVSEAHAEVLAQIMPLVDRAEKNTAAVLAHEVPSEVGNFAILLHSGMSRARALAWNLITALGAVIGGVGLALRVGLGVRVALGVGEAEGVVSPAWAAAPKFRMMP